MQHQRRLAGAVGSQQGDPLPRVHVAITGARRPAHIEGIAPAAEIEVSEGEGAEIDELSGAAKAWGLTPDG